MAENINKELIELALKALIDSRKLEHLVDRDLRERAIKELEKALKAKPVTKEPIAWESTTSFYTKYVTDSRYRKFSPAVQKWYKPYVA